VIALIRKKSTGGCYGAAGPSANPSFGTLQDDVLRAAVVEKPEQLTT